MSCKTFDDPDDDQIDKIIDTLCDKTDTNKPPIDFIESIPYNKLVRLGQLMMNIHCFISTQKYGQQYNSTGKKIPHRMLFPGMTKVDINKWVYNRGADTYIQWQHLFNQWRSLDNWSSIKSEITNSIYSSINSLDKYSNLLMDVPLSFFSSFQEVNDVPRKWIKMVLVDVFGHYLK